MIKNFLLITLRSMMKNKLFLFINIFGMAIGIGCCIVAYFNWEHDASWDAHHTNKEKIYRVSMTREFEGQTRLHSHASFPLGEIVQQTIPDASKSTRFSLSWSNFKIGDNLFYADLGYVDPDFFEMFSFELLSGKPADLKDKSKLFVSQEMAMRLFGSQDVVGKMVTQVIGNDLKEFQVAGVFKNQPKNSSFQRSSYANFENVFDDDKNLKRDDWRAQTTLFLQVDDPTRVNTITAQLQQYKTNHNKVREDFQIQAYVVEPFEGMAHRDRATDTWADTRESNPIPAVIAPIFMAVLLLLIACFNMTNTSIAISSRRLKEIGVRKVMGSMRMQLVVQFIGETMFICAIALIIGLFMGELLINAWNSLWEEMKITSHYQDNPGIVLFLLGMLLFTGLISGGYPALYISNFEPVSILKGKLRFGGTNWFTRVLLGLQYTFSFIGLVCAIAFYQNSIYQRDFDLGVNQDGIIIAYVDNGSEFEVYRNALLENKDILGIAGSEHSVYSSRYSTPVKYQSKQTEVEAINVGDHYLKTMGLTLLDGRDFEKDSETDQKESIIITEKFAATFNWDKPLGKEIIWHDSVKLYVVGVVKDVYTQGLWRETQPMMIRYANKEKYTHVIVNVPVEKATTVNTFMESQWREVFPNRLYNGRYINEIMIEAYTVNNNIVKIFVFLGVVALMLSATGLFTLVSLNIIKRMKEIGVRKVLGASVGNISRIINAEFAIILSVAALLGCFLSALLVDALMDSIWDYYQATGSLTFVIAIVLMFITSAITIGAKVLGAAATNPVNTLRVE
ncbi:ABC transporter permease [Pseudochryseolinea flava]|uniref:ABC transporter permease n=1 Tax=Pseudochryseolinea flava TaxID=2059302 RepID=A0A364XWA7_9BACT|nr:ABC transporter permease [Pseudochryseolinea flava]RAV98618.1 hypothetical protein DQQ10_23065 [Pseudochryseolinea flava]